MSNSDAMNMPGMGAASGSSSNMSQSAQPQGMEAPPALQPASAPFMSESMADMPMLVAKRVWTVTGTENWSMLTGFGPAAGMVAMMDGMMVAGSPMAHMKMGKMNMSMTEMGAPTPEEARAASSTAPQPASSALMLTAAVTPNPPIVGDNQVFIIVTNRSGTRMPGLNLAATVAMVTMDMGTAHPKVNDLGEGRYAATVEFTMAGPWRVVISAADGGPAVAAFDFQAGGAPALAGGPKSQAPAAAPAKMPLAITASISPLQPKVGGNLLTVTVKDASGKPVAGATVTASVAMKTMDMGTAHGALREIGGGRYRGTVTFGMSGLWQVVVTVKSSIISKPQSVSLDFNAS